MQYYIIYRGYVLKVTSVAIDVKTLQPPEHRYYKYIATKVTLREAMRAIYHHRRASS